MDDDLERIQTKVVIVQLRYYTRICPEGLRKTTKNLSMITSVPAKVWTQHLLNMSLQQYRTTKTFGSDWFLSTCNLHHSLKAWVHTSWPHKRTVKSAFYIINLYFSGKQIKCLTLFNRITILGPKKKVPWMVGWWYSKLSHFCLLLTFPSSLLWPMSTSPKHLSLAVFITSNIYVNRMCRHLEGNTGKYTGRKVKELKAHVKWGSIHGLHPTAWVQFIKCRNLWSQVAYTWTSKPLPHPL
jgi:hypothetical protein